MFLSYNQATRITNISTKKILAAIDNEVMIRGYKVKHVSPGEFRTQTRNNNVSAIIKALRGI